MNRYLIVVCLLAFMNDFMIGLVEPTFTIYALSLGASMTFIGLLSSARNVTGVLSNIPFGRLSDRRGRKPFLLISKAGTSITYFTYSLATTFWHLFPGRLLHGVTGSANQVSERSYLADITRSSKLSVAMGFYTLSMGIGVITGPLAGGRLVSIFGFRGTYTIAALLGVFTVSLVIFGIKRNPAPPASSITRVRTSLKENLKSVLKNRAILSVVLLSSLNMLGYQVIVEYLPAYITALGFSTVDVGDLFFFRGIFTAAIRLPIGLIADRIGNWRLMMTAIAMQSAALFAVPFSGNYQYQMLLIAVQGLSFGMFLVIQTTYIMQIAPSNARGITLGVIGTVSGTLSATYGPIRGVTADIFGVGFAFQVMATAIGFGALTIALVSRRLRSSEGSTRTIEQKA